MRNQTVNYIFKRKVVCSYDSDGDSNYEIYRKKGRGWHREYIVCHNGYTFYKNYSWFSLSDTHKHIKEIEYCEQHRLNNLKEKGKAVLELP